MSINFSAWVNKWLPQMAHVGWGAFLFMALNRHITGWHAALVVVTFATTKEGIFDPLTETVELQGSGLVDFSFWISGLALGILATL